MLPTASARTVTHTLTFTSVQQATANFSPTIGAAEDKDVTKTDKVIGYDVIRFSFNPKTNTASLGVAVDLNGGFLYGAMRESAGPVTRGTVTGGTGAFNGATGPSRTAVCAGLRAHLRLARASGVHGFGLHALGL